MMNIGCDIGKNSLDVFLGGKHRKFENNGEGINKFVSICRENINIRVVVEPTGGYERRLLRELFSNEILVSVVNPYYVRNFAKSKRDLAKTDKMFWRNTERKWIRKFMKGKKNIDLSLRI